MAKRDTKDEPAGKAAKKGEKTGGKAKRGTGPARAGKKKATKEGARGGEKADARRAEKANGREQEKEGPGTGQETPLVALARQIDQEMRELERRVNTLFADTAVEWKERFPLLAGWNLTPTASGMPLLERFGTLGSAMEGFLEGWRRPVMEHHIDEEANRLTVMVELPGIEKDDIEVEVRADAIRIQAETAERRYRGTLTIGRGLEEDSADAVYAEGVLTITVDLSRPSGGKGHSVKVK